MEKIYIKFGLQVNIERVPLGTPPQAVVMTLAHNHVANLFISSYRGAAITLSGKKVGEKLLNFLQVTKFFPDFLFLDKYFFPIFFT